jgi:RNA polymerase sigma-70 factor (ECF subfamily)
MDPAELHALARRAQAGDQAAVTALLRDLYQVIRKQIHFQLGAGALADDAAQETMIALHRGLPRFRGDASPRTWATTIAARTARRVRRREARQPIGEVDVEIAVFDTDLAGAAELVLLRKALALLAPKKRDAFVLMGILELTAEEAGHALGTFANTAASRFRHARAELEAHLARQDAPAAAPATRRAEEILTNPAVAGARKGGG